MTVRVKYTQGAGNNIFQYVYARLLAETHNQALHTEALPFIDVPANHVKFTENVPLVEIGLAESDFHKYLDVKRSPANYLVYTYPEDYTIYKPHLKQIRSWFFDMPVLNENDLVFHLRLGDRLVTRRDHDPCMKIEVEEYIEAIGKFDFERLHIVTDMPVWKTIVESELNKMRFHISVPQNQRIESDKAVKYFNSLVNGLSKFNPKVRCGKRLRDDFNFMRSFNQILFQHGTFAWWAATLSHASKVGVFGPWRPIKGNSNKNLGDTDFEGWFKWGDSRNS